VNFGPIQTTDFGSLGPDSGSGAIGRFDMPNDIGWDIDGQGIGPLNSRFGELKADWLRRYSAEASPPLAVRDSGGRLPPEFVPDLQQKALDPVLPPFFLAHLDPMHGLDHDKENDEDGQDEKLRNSHVSSSEIVRGFATLREQPG
jgi:hypothetical protein